MYKILSASTADLLELIIKEYEVTSLGSLVIHNGHYFQSILYKPKVTTKKTTTTKPKVTPRKPKVKPKE